MVNNALVKLILLSSFALIGCSGSASVEGRYVLEGNDKVYLELKATDGKNGTVSDSGTRDGVYHLRDNSITMTEKSGEWIGLGYFRGSDIFLSEYHGTRKEHRFIKQSASSSASTSAQATSGGKLTTDRVQRALDKALASVSKGGAARVLGIQELLQENSARADIKFDSFQYDAVIVGRQNYSGQGIALLSHYNDGRWVLTQVHIKTVDSITTNVEVE